MSLRTRWPLPYAWQTRTQTGSSVTSMSACAWREVAEKGERTYRPGARRGHAPAAPGGRAEDAEEAADLPDAVAGRLVRRRPLPSDRPRHSASVPVDCRSLTDEPLGPTARPTGQSSAVVPLSSQASEPGFHASTHAHARARRVSKLIKDPVGNVFIPPVDAEERISFVPTFHPELCDPGHASGSHL